MNKSDLEQILKRKNELIKAQGEYIEFLGNEMSRTATYLFTNNMLPSEEVCLEGERLREKIKNLQ